MVLKSRNKADLDQAQRDYWWRKTPAERLAAAERLHALARQLRPANPADQPSAHGNRLLKSATPVPRARR